MLKHLTIQNAALIERASVSFTEGLNVLSGETGAGKSVILDCIDFVLGAKADRELIRTGAEECFVRAEFSCDDDRVISVLSELDVEADDTLILSRRLTAEGKSVLKINGCSVTAAMLRRVTAYLVDIHGQSEHFALLKESNQLRLLDETAGKPAADCKEALKEALGARKRITADLSLLGGDEAERERRLDILRYQIEEIERGAPREGEEEELSALLERYRNAEKILSGLEGAREWLLGDGRGADGANGARKMLAQLVRFGEKYAELAERLENVAAEMEDVADCAETYAEELDIDGGEAERAEARLDEIRTLKKKYGGSAEKIADFLTKAREEYELLSHCGERFRALSSELTAAEDAIYRYAVALDEARKKAAAEFTRRVTEELKTLNISSAQFRIDFREFSRADVPKATSEGLGGVVFLFSANAGEPPKELGKIISGGEMSRFMLAVKTQLSGGGADTYLFDEIDAGISGRTARVVAEKFLKIARRAQIIAVTHSAQIAAAAEKAFLLEKTEADGRTRTEIRAIEGEERLREIARLVGGEEGEYALKHAEELLNAASRYKETLI